MRNLFEPFTCVRNPVNASLIGHLVSIAYVAGDRQRYVRMWREGVITCGRCGTENPEGSRFCAQCGNALSVAESEPADAPPPAKSDLPSPTTNSPIGQIASPAQSERHRAADPTHLPPSSPEWRMSDAGPLPEPRRRRTWRWIVLGMGGVCLLVCILTFAWANTLGEDVVREFLSTAEAQATQSASDR